ncbi:MAG: hypothetical protein Q8P52_00460 [bacterium]|nr:hypothetical protein [bacterium]
MKNILRALLLIVIVFLFVWLAQSKNDILVTAEKKTDVPAFVTSDSDNDGLKDWEEELWGTDPFNPDTDGDGTSDGDEIREGRDPTKPAPGDELSKEEIEKKVNVEVETDLNATEKFAREFFATYVGDKSGQNQNPIYDTTLGGVLISSNIISNIKEYTAKDIKITSSRSVSTLKSYGNAFGKALKESTPEGAEHELLIYQRAIEGDDPSELENLKIIVDGYNDLQSRLLNITVPINAVSAHIRFINSITLLMVSLESMTQSFNDPVGALQGIKYYPTAAEAMTTATKDLKTLFSQNGIVFTQSDDGYYLVSSI